MENTVLRWIYVLIIVFLSADIAAQNFTRADIPDTSKADLKQALHQEDAMDILKKVFKVKLDHHQEDSSKLRPGVIYPAVFPAIGYTIANGGTATIGANFSFYTDSIKNTNLSTVVSDPLYSTEHQFIFPIISSVWTSDNRWNFLGDWRYYRYPSFTFGLGGFTTPADADQIDYSYIKVYQEALYYMGRNIYGGLGYELDDHFGITNDGSTSNFDNYSMGVSHTVSSGLVAHIKYDSRANTNNPIDALFASVTYRYNTTLLASDNNWQSTLIEIRDYIKLSPKNDNVLAFWSWNEFTFGGKAPYLDLPSTGWDTYANSGRGYIQGRFRGTSLIYLESEFRFGITRNGLIGGVVFINGTSVPEWPGTRFETINPGYGGGLRLKMNRYSNTNFCVDYGFGNQGSKGFFFNLGEVF